MTKERLQRLLELTECCVSREGWTELEALKAEFAAWQPVTELPRCPNCDYLSWECRRCAHVEMSKL